MSSTPTEPDTDAMTVEAAWALYNIGEQELWDDYATDPTRQTGQVYLVGEVFLRRRCRDAVSRIRADRFERRGT